MLIHKFGGAILTSKQDIQRAVGIIEQRRPGVVVVSALNGVTDELINLLQKARKGEEAFTPGLGVLRQKHVELSKSEEVARVFAGLEKLLTGISCVGEYSDRLYSFVLSRGEYLSALIFSEATGYSFWPAEKGIAALGDYLNSRCDFPRSTAPPLNSVVTGFYGVNSKGEACLFGRGGTDYTAACMAKLLGAEKLEFWKNVDGFMSADPRIEPSAKFLEKLSFEEASELCRFGAKILHPSALEPLFGTTAAVEVKNIYKPEQGGTVIANGGAGNHLAAVTGRNNVAVVSVSGNEMVQAFGIAARILGKVADAGISVDAIATAHANISFSVEERDAERAAVALTDFRQFEIKSKKDLALVGIIGNGIKTNSSFISRVFSALAKSDVRVEMISQGASEIDLSLIVNKRDYEKAVQAIHAEFFGGKEL